MKAKNEGKIIQAEFDNSKVQKLSCKTHSCDESANSSKNYKFIKEGQKQDKAQRSKVVVEGGGSIIQLQGHDLPVNDVMSGIAVGNVDSRVLTDGLGQSLFEPLVEGARHVIDKGFLVLLQLLNGGVPRSYLRLQSLLLHTEPADLDL